MWIDGNMGRGEEEAALVSDCSLTLTGAAAKCRRVILKSRTASALYPQRWREGSGREERGGFAGGLGQRAQDEIRSNGKPGRVLGKRLSTVRRALRPDRGRASLRRGRVGAASTAQQ